MKYFAVNIQIKFSNNISGDKHLFNLSQNLKILRIFLNIQNYVNVCMNFDTPIKKKPKI